jgi:hypothetical protein
MLYDSRRVLTIKELEPEMVLHSGQIADGVCAEWSVERIADDYSKALLCIYGTYIQVTGHELRHDPQPWYPADRCPLPHKRADAREDTPGGPESGCAALHRVPEALVGREHVRSSLESRRLAFRMHIGDKKGGAFMRRNP